MIREIEAGIIRSEVTNKTPVILMVIVMVRAIKIVKIMRYLAGLIPIEQAISELRVNRINFCQLRKIMG